MNQEYGPGNAWNSKADAWTYNEHILSCAWNILECLEMLGIMILYILCSEHHGGAYNASVLGQLGLSSCILFYESIAQSINRAETRESHIAS